MPQLQTFNLDSWEQTRTMHRILRTISPQLHDVLLGLYWTHHGTVLGLLNKDSFESCRLLGDGPYYSQFLHLSMLAMGHRFADQTDHNVQQIAIGSRGSTFHHDAKMLMWHELEAPKISTVAALLILSDLECGIGNSSLGRRFAGMGFQIALDLDLHLANETSNVSKGEIEIRRRILLTCSLYDKNWALLAGQANLMKMPQIAWPRHRSQKRRRSESGSAPQSQMVDELEEQISVATDELQAFAGKTIEIRDAAESASCAPAQISTIYSSMASLDREITAWYQNLPPELQWTSSNRDISPPRFFLFHQQYHAILIRLHRLFAWDWVQNDQSLEDGGLEQTHLKHLAAISQSVCSDHAVQIARIFDAQLSRFHHHILLLPQLQAAVSAAGTLMDDIVQTDELERRDLSARYLKVVLHTLTMMVAAFQPAEVMTKAIQNFLSTRAL